MTYFSSYTDSPAIIHWTIGLAVLFAIMFYNPNRNKNKHDLDKN